MLLTSAQLGNRMLKAKIAIYRGIVIRSLIFHSLLATRCSPYSALSASTLESMRKSCTLVKLTRPRGILIISHVYQQSSKSNLTLLASNLTNLDLHPFLLLKRSQYASRCTPGMIAYPYPFLKVSKIYFLIQNTFS